MVKNLEAVLMTAGKLGCFYEVTLLSKNDNSDQCISLQEACKNFGIEGHTIVSCLEEHRGVPSFNVGKPWSFMTVDIGQWVRNCKASHEGEGM